MKTSLWYMYSLAVLVVGALVLSGCKGDAPSSNIYVKNVVGQRIKIAVLPFDNVSKDQDAGRIVTNTVITYLLSTGAYDVVEPGVVNSALAAEGIRLNEGLSADDARKLQARVKADAFIIGLVEDYGDLRVGADTYPSISFSARLLDAQTADILWAATITKSGDENVKLFDIGRVSSLGKLSKSAISAMADSLVLSKQMILKGVAAHQSTAVAAPTETPKVTTRYLDEAPVYGEKEITTLLKDAPGYTLGAVNYKKHYHDMVETQYLLADKKFIEVKLVDYRKVVTAKKFLELDHPGEKQTTAANLPAYTGESEFGYYHLDIAVGRFGLALRGPKAHQAEIDTLGNTIIGFLK